MTIRTKIVRIGNSQGLRLSKSLLEESGITGDVDVEARIGEIVIHPVRAVRQNWDSVFSEMSARGDDSLLDPGPRDGDWEETEWEWG